MNVPKIDPAELAHLQNEDFFRLKGELDIKVNQLFSLIKDLVGAELESKSSRLPRVLLHQPGRTFRGENYQGFPWRALDIPRASQKPDLFLYRCLLLWGHDFSFHLILSGHWKSRYKDAILNAHADLGELGFSLDCRESAWEWISDENLVRPLSQLSQDHFAHAFEQHAHLKLTLRVGFEQFDSLPNLALSVWRSLDALLFNPA